MRELLKYRDLNINSTNFKKVLGTLFFYLDSRFAILNFFNFVNWCNLVRFVNSIVCFCSWMVNHGSKSWNLPIRFWLLNCENLLITNGLGSNLPGSLDKHCSSRSPRVTLTWKTSSFTLDTYVLTCQIKCALVRTISSYLKLLNVVDAIIWVFFLILLRF